MKSKSPKKREAARKKAFESEKLNADFIKMRVWLSEHTIKLAGFRISKKTGRYISTDTHAQVERRNVTKADGTKIVREIRLDEKGGLLSITNGTWLQKRGRADEWDADTICEFAKICFYIANVENPIPNRSLLFGYMFGPQTTVTISKIALKVKRHLLESDVKFNEIKSSKSKALYLLRSCLSSPPTKAAGKMNRPTEHLLPVGKKA